jgi:hypothetical protein
VESRHNDSVLVADGSHVAVVLDVVSVRDGFCSVGGNVLQSLDRKDAEKVKVQKRKGSGGKDRG